LSTRRSSATERLLMMSLRQVADLWGRAAIGATARQRDWALFHQELLAAPRVRLAHSARSLAPFASYTDLRLSHTEIVRWVPERHSDLGKAETS